MKRIVLIFLALSVMITSALCLLGVISQPLRQTTFTEHGLLESATAIFYSASSLALLFLIIRLKMKKALLLLPLTGIMFFVEELDPVSAFIQTTKTPAEVEAHHFLDLIRTVIPRIILITFFVMVAALMAIMLLTRKFENQDLIMLWALGISAAIAIDLIQNRPFPLTYIEELLELNASLAFLFNTIQIPLNITAEENSTTGP
jgi:hypothetical protein